MDIKDFTIKILKFLTLQIIIIYCIKYKDAFFNKEVYSKKAKIFKSNYNNISFDYSSTNNVNNTTNLNESLNDINTIKIISKKKYDIYMNPYYEKEAKFYEIFLSLKKFPDEQNNSMLLESIKQELIRNIKDNYNVDFSTIDKICFDSNFRFGNQLAVFNKLLFYCEILGIKKLYINKDNNLFIKNSIFDEKYDLGIEIYENINDEDCGHFSYITYLPNFFYDFYVYRVENRFSVFKDEILRNLPTVEIEPNDLYIHFRGDDIFTKSFNNPDHAPAYAPYPLCFYQKIIEKNNFKKIYLISEDKLNPIIDILLNNYTNTIYNKNSLEDDISYLAHAYNLVGSISSFVISIIKLNDNLKFFWEYDIYQKEHQLYHLHHSLYNYLRNFTIFRMEPSEQYKKNMYIWARTDEQMNIMLNDICPNGFKIF